ncbi:MAG: permease-like cell division protein FtsX [Lachnospiraceae bacterium]|nr:permease-like cell division protein FtsX [Lachnospiraceae bacterium]
MIIGTFFYCIGQGLVNIRRHFLYTLASIATITACVFLFSVFYSVVENLRYTVKMVEETVGITVFFDKELSEEEIMDIGSQIGLRDEVREMNFVSAEEAWAEFQKEYLAGAEDLAAGFIDDNPLANMPSYEIFLKDVEQQGAFVSWLEQQPGVRRVNASSIAAEGLVDMNNAIGYVSIGMIVILLCVSVFLINNTISMAINARKDEIRIMRLVGATKGFIRAPFMVEGLFIGLVGAAIPMGLMVLLYDRAIAYLEGKLAILAGLMSFMELETVMQMLIPVAVVLGIGIGFFGSRAAVRKHLKV